MERTPIVRRSRSHPRNSNLIHGGILFIASVAAVSRSAAAADCSGGFTAGDQAAIRAVVEEYRTAWLRGDSEGVLKTFTADAVLLPAHGGLPVAGTEAIVRYWWPKDAPATSVTKLDITVEGLEGGCSVASSYGRDDVAWTQEENGVARSYGHPGTYLNVFRKGADGKWRIARHMWDDGPANR